MQDKEQDNLDNDFENHTSDLHEQKNHLKKIQAYAIFAVGGLLFIFLMVYFLKSFSGNNNDIEEAPKEENNDIAQSVKTKEFAPPPSSAQKTFDELVAQEQPTQTTALMLEAEPPKPRIVKGIGVTVVASSNNGFNGGSTGDRGEFGDKPNTVFEFGQNGSGALQNSNNFQSGGEFTGEVFTPTIAKVSEFDQNLLLPKGTYIGCALKTRLVSSIKGGIACIVSNDVYSANGNTLLIEKGSLGELASKNSDFDYLAKNLLNAQIFKCKEFQSPNDGDEKSIETLSLKDLQNFYKNFIHLSDLVVILGGDLEEKQAKEDLLKLLSKLQIGKKNTPKKYELGKNIKDEILVRPESEQAYIYFATPFFADFKDKDLYLAKIALFVLGQGGFGSRIMEEIRVKRGLAYSAYAMLDMNMSFSRVFGYLQTKNESAKEAKKIVKELFEDFIKNGMTQNELDQAKNFLIGSTPLRYESLSKRLSMSFNEFYQGLNLGYYKEELKLMEKVKLETINAYIKKHQELLNISFASIQNEN